MGIGAVMFLAPVPFLLEVGSDFGIAQGADFLGNTMLSAPPAAMLVASMFGSGFGPVIVAVFVLGRGLFAATAESEQEG